MLLFIFLFILGIVIIYFICKENRNGTSKAALIITTIAILVLFGTCVEYGFVPSGKRYVSVSGYYRSDGTYVHPYKRSYPGEKNKSAGTSYRWLFGIGIIIVGLGGLYLADYYENSRNKNNRPGGKDGTGGDEPYYIKADNLKRDLKSSQTRRTETLKPIVENDSNDLNLNFPQVIASLLSYNTLFDDLIIEPVTCNSIYNIEEYANLIFAHKLYNAGCPYIIVHADKRVYLRYVTYGDKNRYFTFTYSQNPKAAYNSSIPLSDYTNLVQTTLNKYKVLLYFEERSLFSCNSRILTLDNILSNNNFVSDYPSYYNSKGSTQWKDKGDGTSLFFPPDYYYIQVKDIYRQALKYKLRKIYDNMQAEIKANWVSCKRANSYTIYRTKNAQKNIIWDEKTKALIDLCDRTYQNLVDSINQNEEGTLNAIYQNMLASARQYHMKRFKFY